MREYRMPLTFERSALPSPNGIQRYEIQPSGWIFLLCGIPKL